MDGVAGVSKSTNKGYLASRLGCCGAHRTLCECQSNFHYCFSQPLSLFFLSLALQYLSYPLRQGEILPKGEKKISQLPQLGVSFLSPLPCLGPFIFFSPPCRAIPRRQLPDTSLSPAFPLLLRRARATPSCAPLAPSFSLSPSPPLHRQHHHHPPGQIRTSVASRHDPLRARVAFAAGRHLRHGAVPVHGLLDRLQSNHGA